MEIGKNLSTVFTFKLDHLKEFDDYTTLHNVSMRYPGRFFECQLGLGVGPGCFAVLVGGLSNPVEPQRSKPNLGRTKF